MRVRDDPLDPDPGFAALYAALPDEEDLFPWLDWCRSAKPPVLYLGIGTGRLAVPLHRAGIELVGVDAHPGMLEHLRKRDAGIYAHQSLITNLALERKFDLVIGPSSILAHWLSSGRHDGVRLRRKPDGSSEMEVDYRLPDGSMVVQVVADMRMSPAPEDTEERLDRFGLSLVWMGAREDHDLEDSPTYFVLASLR